MSECEEVSLSLTNIQTVADLGGGGGADAPPPQGFDPRRPKGSSLCTILRYPFLVTEPKNVLKAPLAPNILILRGDRAPKKRDFLVNIFQKVPKNAVENWSK